MNSNPQSSLDNNIHVSEGNTSQSHLLEANTRNLNELNERNETNIYEKKIKRNREYKNVKTDYHDGEVADLSTLKVTDEDKVNYERLKKHLVKCQLCSSYISIMDVFLVKNVFVCLKCAKNNKLPLINLKNDFYEHLEKYEGLENYDFKKMRLFKCRRLNHSKPSFLFVNFTKRSGYQYKSNCLFCKNYKSQEYSLAKNKRLN